jgi:hypothetical protein
MTDSPSKRNDLDIIENSDEYKLRITQELKQLLSSSQKNGSNVEEQPQTESERNIKKEPKKRGQRRKQNSRNNFQRTNENRSKIETFLRLSKSLNSTPQNIHDDDTISQPFPSPMKAHSRDRVFHPTVSAPDSVFEFHRGGDPFLGKFGSVEDNLDQIERQRPMKVLRLSALSLNAGKVGFTERVEAFVFAPRPGTSSIDARIGTDPMNDIVVSFVFCLSFKITITVVCLFFRFRILVCHLFIV